MSKIYISVEEDRQQLVVDGSLSLFDKLLAVLLGRKSASLRPDDVLERPTAEDSSRPDTMGVSRGK